LRRLSKCSGHAIDIAKCYQQILLTDVVACAPVDEVAVAFEKQALAEEQSVFHHVMKITCS
jgi:hypothetical protein